MIKQNKKILILTTLVMLIPMAVGLLLWNKLPEQVPSHWDINGNADGWSSRAGAVLGFPSLLLGIHWLCVIASSADPKHKNYSPKMFTLVLWICPVITLVLNTMVYAIALGHQLRVELIMPLLVGMMFVVVGNLLPKCCQTYTLGIKLPWTLASEENWNMTHRFGGKVWVVCGIVTMATAILGSFWLLIGVLVVAVAAPTLYSYLYYRNHEKGKER